MNQEALSPDPSRGTNPLMSYRLQQPRPSGSSLLLVHFGVVQGACMSDLSSLWAVPPANPSPPLTSAPSPALGIQHRGQERVRSAPRRAPATGCFRRGDKSEVWAFDREVRRTDLAGWQTNIPQTETERNTEITQAKAQR